MNKHDNTLLLICKDNKMLIMFILFLLLFIEIGYAAVNVTLNLSGTASVTDYNDILIESVELYDSNGVTETKIRKYQGNNITTENNFSTNELSYITYRVTLTNGTDNIKRYTENNFEQSGSNIKYELSDNLYEGLLISPNESITFDITYSYLTTTTGTYDLSSTFMFEDVGDFYGYTNTNSVDLDKDNKIPINIKNNLTTNESYTLSLDNDLFKLVDSNSNDISNLTINANAFNVTNVYLKMKDGTNYYSSTYTTNLILTHNGEATTLKNISIKLTPNATDTESPNIGTVSIDILNDNGSMNVNWSRTDTGGSDLKEYVVMLYDSDNTLVDTIHTSKTTYQFNSMNEKTYYAVIYGIDELNSGESYCSTATTSSKYCRKSSNVIAKWTFTVTDNTSNITFNGETTASRGQTYTATLAVSGLYSLPSSITVVMGGTTLTSGSGYTYSSSSGALSIPNVTGDITVSGSASGCLVSGTKVLLANNTYKNIEDITYNDLLKVWDYSSGSFTYEYPIWIEKEGTSSRYQLTTFSDSTTLKTVGYHGVYNADTNEFISVDSKNFKVGTNILKVKDDKLTKVTVTNIEYVYEDIKYYHVVSTRFYNIIADNVLTTDGNVLLSNLYGFNNNVTWKNKTNDSYNYEEFNNKIPYYMYKGMRINDLKYLVDNNYITKEAFIYYFLNNQMNTNMLLQPSGKWTVSTSDNDIRIVDEGSIYILSKPNNNEYTRWYNTADGNIYNAFDKVKIYTGTHFIAIN